MDENEQQHNNQSSKYIDERLIKAIQSNDIARVETLVMEEGADPNGEDKDGILVLMYGVHTENVKMVETLVKLGADPNGMSSVVGITVLIDAFEIVVLGGVEIGVDMLETLVRLGADPNRKERNGKTALMIAIESHDINIVKTLVRLGADINAVNDYGYTVLMHVVKNIDDPELIKKLVELGADINFRNDEGDTALTIAVEEGQRYPNSDSHLNVLNLLVQLGADVNGTDTMGVSALIRAVWNRKNNIKIVEALIQLGANVNQRDTEGGTPLIAYAVRDMDIVELLLRSGADINNRDTDDRRTVLMHAVNIEDDEQRTTAIERIIELGAKINTQDRNGNTALLHAAHKGLEPVVELLIQKGADITIRNKKGENVQDILARLKKEHRYIGQFEGYGDRDAPYQIYQSAEFVANTQYRPIKPEDNKELRNILENDPKPHLVYSCPSGHLHWSEACGVPTEVGRCGRDTTPEGGAGPCTMLVGGIHHLLCPGAYVVYHDNEDDSVSKIWYGTFPAYTYPTYLQMIKQYNMAVEWSRDNTTVELYEIEPEEEKIPEDVARKINTGEYREVIVKQEGCPFCGDEFDENGVYYLLNCGHLLCESCLRDARQGDLANINDGNVENRKCGICSKRFHFGSLQKIKLYRFKPQVKSLCSIM